MVTYLSYPIPFLFLLWVTSYRGMMMGLERTSGTIVYINSSLFSFSFEVVELIFLCDYEVESLSDSEVAPLCDFEVASLCVGYKMES